MKKNFSLKTSTIVLVLLWSLSPAQAHEGDEQPGGHGQGGSPGEKVEEALAPIPPSAAQASEICKNYGYPKPAISSGKGKIDDICADEPQLSKVRTKIEFVDAVCRIQSRHANSPDVQAKAKVVLDTFDGVNEQEALSEALKDPRVKGSLEAFKNTLDPPGSGKAVKRLGSPSNTELGKKLRKLFTDFPDVKSRTEKKKEYVAALDDILASTETGKKILECFRKQSDTVGGRQLVLIDEETRKKNPVFANYDMAMEPARNSKNKWVKRIYFNVDLEPEEALTLYAHELQHGCLVESWGEHGDALLAAEKALQEHPTMVALLKLQDQLKNDPNNKEIQDQIAKLEADPKVAELNDKAWEARISTDQFQLIDETRAYTEQMKLFQEVAKEAPNVFCKPAFVSRILGTQVATSGQYHSVLERSSEDGTLPLLVAEHYVGSGTLSPVSIYITDDSGNPVPGPDGKFQINDDAKKKLREAGFNVR